MFRAKEGKDERSGGVSVPNTVAWLQAAQGIVA